MHRYRTSLILGGLAVVGLAYIWFVDRSAQTTDEAHERRDNVFARFEEDDVDRLVLRGEGRTVVLEKKDGHWRMKEPVETAADDGAVSSLLSTIGFLTKERTVGGSDARRQKEIGLARPRIRGEFRQKGVITRFAVGAEDAAGRNVYVAIGDGSEVFAVGKEFYESLAKDPSELRDKKITGLRMSDVERIRISGGATAIEAVRDGAGYRMEAPVKGARASQAKLDDVLRGLENLSAERFVADGATDLARFGLDPAWRTLVARMRHGDPVEVRVGRPCEGHEGERHVTRVGSRTVACAKADLWAILEGGPEVYREKRLATVRADDVRKISIAGGGTRVEIERAGERWRLVRPQEGPADGDAVERLVEDLRRSEASAFVPVEALGTKGLEPPRTTIVLELEGDDPPQRIAIGAKDGDAVWARRGDEPTVLRVPASILDVVKASSIRFRPRQLLNDDSLDARALRIEAGPGAVSQELEKEEGVWKVTSPIGGRADSLSTRDLVRRIGELTVERFDAERPEPRHGLAAPRLTIHARFEREGDADAGPAEEEDAGGSNAPPRPRERVREYTLLVGTKTDGGWFAQLRGEDPVFVLPDAFVDDASRPLVDRNAFQIDEGSAKRIRLERTGKAPVNLVRDGEGWRREGGGAVDATKVRDLFDKLGGARATKAVAYGAAAPAEGFALPRARLVISRDDPPEGEPNEVTILLGAKVGTGDEEGAYARRTDVAATLVLPKDVAEAILGLET